MKRNNETGIKERDDRTGSFLTPKEEVIVALINELDSEKDWFMAFNGETQRYEIFER